MGFRIFGIIAVPLDKVRREYGWKNITVERRKRIEEYLQGEIKTLDDYYTGEVSGIASYRRVTMTMNWTVVGDSTEQTV